MATRYLVSHRKNAKAYSGSPSENLYKTRTAAQARVKKVKKLTGKQYYISKIELVGGKG